MEIGRDGWRVITSPPVRFRRSAGMLPLPIPEQGGSIEALKSFLNLASRNDFVLILCWVLGIEIAFFREGRAGTRMIRMTRIVDNTVSTVSAVDPPPSNGSGVNESAVAGFGE